MFLKHALRMYSKNVRGYVSQARFTAILFSPHRALTRPGRFDMQVFMDPPDHEGRKDIFDLYLNRIRLYTLHKFTCIDVRYKRLVFCRTIRIIRLFNLSMCMYSFDTESVSLDKLAASTTGFTGADYYLLKSYYNLLHQ